MTLDHNLVDIPSLNHLLDFRAQEHGDKMLFSFIDRKLQPKKELNYRQFRQSALSIASHLRRHTKVGDRAVLLFPPGLEYVEAYFGCLYAGVIAVPVFPPQMGRQIKRVMQIVGDSRPSVFMSTGDVFDQVKTMAPQWVESAGGSWMCTDRLEEIPLEAPHEAGPDEIAFLQYTSGSTGNPKGVMVSHGNLLQNEEMIKNGFGSNENIVCVNWLPLYHDMGLIGAVLHPLYMGGTSILMSPFTFLTGPFNWLNAISTFRGTACGGPNFAYEMCVNKITDEQVGQLDLSSWTQAFNGAEPIRASTLARFEEKFAPAGFNPDSWRPCYGLAEATLMVSTGTTSTPKTLLDIDMKSLKGEQAMLGQGEDPSMTLVSSGFPVINQELLVVHPETRTPMEELGIGEVWIAGPHVARGYWEKPKINEAEFGAYLADGSKGPYFRTGDLGFVYEGQLYITGRQKDLIIVRGKNHYPQDIELTAMEAHPAIQPGGTVAFSIEGERGEALVIVSELQRNGLKKNSGEEIAAAIRQEVASTHELQAKAIVLIPRKGILKTSSGKVQRRANKKSYLEGKMDILFLWEGQEEDFTPDTNGGTGEKKAVQNEARDLKSWIMQWLAAKLDIGMDQIDMADPITAYGVDSLMLAEFETEVSEYLGRNWPVRDLLLTEPSLEELVEKGEEWMAEG